MCSLWNWIFYILQSPSLPAKLKTALGLPETRGLIQLPAYAGKKVNDLPVQVGFATQGFLHATFEWKLQFSEKMYKTKYAICFLLTKRKRKYFRLSIQGRKHKKMSHFKLNGFLEKAVVIMVALTTLKMINDFESPQPRLSKAFSFWNI